MTEQRQTLTQQIATHLAGDPARAAELGPLLDRIAAVGRRLAGEVARAAFLGRLGLAGAENRSGEAQKKLDVAANDALVEGFAGTPLIGMILSEELDEPLIPDGTGGGPYTLCIDPIDGSSNTDVNGTLGTIFGFYRQPADRPADAGGASLPQGTDIVASGYILYGPATVLVYTAGDGVFGFTLDGDRFLLTHDRLRCPARGHYFSANLGARRGWHEHLGRYLDYVTDGDPETRRPYSLRYVGALVADLHRCLIDGGIYFYPAEARRPDGKLRLLYECAPLAFLMEQAGGRASTGTERILDLETRAPHQRTPIAIGSRDEVALYESFLRHGTPS